MIKLCNRSKCVLFWKKKYVSRRSTTYIYWSSPSMQILLTFWYSCITFRKHWAIAPEGTALTLLHPWIRGWFLDIYWNFCHDPRIGSDALVAEWIVWLPRAQESRVLAPLQRGRNLRLFHSITIPPILGPKPFIATFLANGPFLGIGFSNLSPYIAVPNLPALSYPLFLISSSHLVLDLPLPLSASYGIHFGTFLAHLSFFPRTKCPLYWSFLLFSL